MPSINNEPDHSQSNRRIGAIFHYGIVVGLILVALSGLSLAFSLVNFFVSVLVLCAGLGVVLGAFGSTASVSIPVQGITVGGSAAIVISLFLIVVSNLDDRYLLLKIQGRLSEASVDLIGDEKYFGGYREDHKTHDFILFGNEIKRDNVSVFITMNDDIEYLFECISADELRPFLASGKTIEWTFQPSEQESDPPRIYNKSGKAIANEVGPCRSFEGDHAGGRAGFKSGQLGQFANVFVGSARAEDPNDQLSVEQGYKVQGLVEKLESDISRVRRNARADLASFGHAVVTPLIGELTIEGQTYRKRLGIVVALSTMLRDNKENREVVIEQIDDDQIRILVDAAADNDRTIRIYASEFLYDLGDPRSIDIALEQAMGYSEEGRFNALLSVLGAVPFASEDQKLILIKNLPNLKSPSTPRTNELIDEIIAMASG